MRTPFVVLMMIAAPAYAEDIVLTHQLRILDSAGEPLNGSQSITVHLYEDDGPSGPLWSETYDAFAQDGYVNLRLGASPGNALPDDVAAQARFVAVEADNVPLGGREPISAVPRSAHAAIANSVSGEVSVRDLQLQAEDSAPCASSGDYGRIRWNGSAFQGCQPGGWANLLTNEPGASGTTGMPKASGMVGYFENACPTGWSPASELNGRVVVGTSTTSAIGATVGNALANAGNRVINEVPSHAHSVNPAAVTASSAGNHAHTVDPPSTTSGGQSANHTHVVDPPNTSTNTTGNHNHSISTRQDDWNVSGGPASTGGPSWGRDNGNPAAYHSTNNNGNHSHTVNIGAFTSGSNSAGHTHAVNIAAFSSASTGSHSHTVDIPNTATTTVGSSSVDVTMPYVQLIGCRLDD